MAKIKNKKDAEYYEEVIRHKRLVSEIMYRLAEVIRRRADSHDDSKLSDSEFPLFVDIHTPENERTYDIKDNNNDDSTEKTPEQLEYLAKLKEVKEKHWSSNRHHPEHFGKAGMLGFHLIDAVEHFADILASSLNQDMGNLKISIEDAANDYNYPKMVKQWFLNTIELIDVLNETK